MLSLRNPKGVRIQFLDTLPDCLVFGVTFNEPKLEFSETKSGRRGLISTNAVFPETGILPWDPVLLGGASVGNMFRLALGCPSFPACNLQEGPVCVATSTHGVGVGVMVAFYVCQKPQQERSSCFGSVDVSTTGEDLFGARKPIVGAPRRCCKVQQERAEGVPSPDAGKRDNGFYGLLLL